jgi:hypothetical protein
MVTKKQYEQGITTVQVTTNTLRRLRVLKAQNDFAHFDELINKALDVLEGEIESNYNTKQGSKRK